MQLTLLGAASAALVMMAGSARADRIRVEVNGERVSFPFAQPTQLAGRVMIPLRGVMQHLGADRVEWRPRSQQVLVSGAGSEMRLRIGNRVGWLDGRGVPLDVPPLIIRGTTMVPLRFVSENLGARVDWIDATQTVYIATPNERVAGSREQLPPEERAARGWRRDRSTAADQDPELRSPSRVSVFPRSGSRVDDPRAEIFAKFPPNADVDFNTVKLRVNGRDVTRDAQILRDGVRFLPIDDLRHGRTDVRLSFRDSGGVLTSREWYFFAP